MSVFQLNLADTTACTAWDAFCARQSGATLCHSSAWMRNLKTAYTAHCRCLGWQKDGAIVAVLPILEVRSLAQRPTLVSTPYGSYGGILPTGLEAAALEGWLNEPEAAALLPLRGRQLVIREAATEAVAEEQVGAGSRVAMWLALPAQAEDLWKGFPAKVRNQVRKAEKEGVTVRRGHELLPDFYRLYLRRMHELGTPAHSAAFFTGLAHEFGDHAEFSVAYHEGRAVAALLDVDWGAWRVNLYGAADIRFRSLCANNLVYWRSLERAVGNGCRQFDFGRSLYPSGQFDFKRQWGARPVPIREWLWSFPTDGGPTTRREMHPPAAPLASRIWQRLPFRVTCWLSPLLRKYVY